MIRWISIVLLLGAPLAFAAPAKPFLVVSDYDDTIKISNTNGGPDAIRRSLFTWDVYGGTPEEFRALDLQADLVVLSGSPRFIGEKVNAVLDRHAFPVRQTLLNPKPIWDSTAEFKREQLDRLTAESSQKLILLGDDTQRDPEVLGEIARALPDQVALVLVHRVTGAALPSGVHGYFTAWEAALAEHEVGALTSAQAREVGEAVLLAPDVELFPDFARCPSSGEISEIGAAAPRTDLPLVEMGWRVAARIAGICGSRP